MYRDDPLDDEAELREILGDDPVDALTDAQPDAQRTPLEVALDVLRVLQGWVSDDAAAGWFLNQQRRLHGRTPIETLAAGAYDDVEEAARTWAAAQG
jgi:hypothetical protein